MIRQSRPTDEKREMGRRPCTEKEEVNRGAWTTEEDGILADYVEAHGEGRWGSLPEKAGCHDIIFA